MKKTKTKATTQILALMGVGIFALSSCTKEVPYKTLSPEVKEQTVSKTLIDENAEYIYSTSMQNASRSSSDALPYSSSDNRRVKLKIEEKSLKVIETERDLRYSANSTNDKLLLVIPSESVSFQCAKDKFGECTNSEEENKDSDWSKRPTLRLDYTSLKMTDLNLLPIMISDTLNEGCYKETSQKVISSTIEKDAINIVLEKTFLTNIECLGDVSSLSDAVVSAVYHISLVKTSSVLSKDFNKVSYPEGSADEGAFGYFTSKQFVLDVDNNKTENSIEQIMNHWNPNRTVIEYHLSDEFAKPENKVIKDLTYETVKRINAGLVDAGVKFQIHLNDPSGKKPGDIRNSMIVLVEDPVESNVIGYGPQTEDPVTGEIFSARTVMFLGTIKKFIRYTYDEIIREKKSEAAKANAKNLASQVSLSPRLQATAQAKKESIYVSGLSDKLLGLVNDPVATVSKMNGPTKAKVESEGLGAGKFTNIKLDQIKRSIKKYTDNVNSEFSGRDVKSQIKYLHYAKNCAYSPNFASAAGGGISKELMDKFPVDAKPWEQLSESEKQHVIDVILPDIWINTLIHEMGHNLGLRHNFAASEDKDNYYSDGDLQKFKIDHAIPFSSVMDYGNDLKTLPVLGKYDIAALKFGYLRQVEVTGDDGKSTFVTISGSLDDKANANLKLKDYKYCTDEHVGINAGCKRFDLGSSYTEIVQNFISDYETAYAQRNFRNGRYSFSLADDLVYAGRISGIFRELRTMMEVAEGIKSRYGLDYTDEQWKKIPFLADLKTAALMSGAFLTKVILTPETMCAVATSDKPNQIIALVPLNQLAADSMNCFSVEMKKPYIVVAEAGKFLNSKKDPNNKNAYVDQIDARGIWADKILATKYLLARQNGVYSQDKTLDNFLSFTEIRTDIVDVLLSLTMNNIVSPVEFTLADGSKTTLEVNYDLFDTQQIEQPLFSGIATRMGLATGRSTQLQEVITNMIANLLIDKTGAHEEDRQIISAVGVTKYHEAIDPQIDKSSISVLINDTRYIAAKTNSLAAEAIMNYKVASILDLLSDEDLKALYDAKKSGATEPPKNDKGEVSDDMKSAWDLKLEDIQNYAMGITKSAPFYVRILDLLPQAK